MTREEKAIIYFKDLRERKIKDYSSVFNTAPKDSVVYRAVSAVIEIYDITIGALEQQFCEDCISREAVIREFSCFSDDAFVTIHKIQEVVKKLPSVTPQPKRGHWINIDDAMSECSECGHREPNERFIFEDMNFCAKCGAKMEGEDGI